MKLKILTCIIKDTKNLLERNIFYEKKIRRNLIRFTSIALTTIMLCGSVVPVWGHDLTDWDNTSGGDSSLDGSDSNVDTSDEYTSWLNSIINDYIDRNEDRKEYMDGGIYYDSGVKHTHEEFYEPRLAEDGWQSSVSEWSTNSDSSKPSWFTGWDPDDSKHASTQPNRYVDTIRVVDLSYSDDSYTDNAYPIFLPNSGSFSFNHHIIYDS